MKFRSSVLPFFVCLTLTTPALLALPILEITGGGRTLGIDGVGYPAEYNYDGEDGWGPDLKMTARFDRGVGPIEQTATYAVYEALSAQVEINSLVVPLTDLTFRVTLSSSGSHGSGSYDFEGFTPEGYEFWFVTRTDEPQVTSLDIPLVFPDADSDINDGYGIRYDIGINAPTFRIFSDRVDQPTVRVVQAASVPDTASTAGLMLVALVGLGTGARWCARHTKRTLA